MCQAPTVDKLHKTQIRATPAITPSLAGVKGIGPPMSEVSDVVTFQAFF